MRRATRAYARWYREKERGAQLPSLGEETRTRTRRNRQRERERVSERKKRGRLKERREGGTGNLGTRCAPLRPSTDGDRGTANSAGSCSRRPAGALQHATKHRRSRPSARLRQRSASNKTTNFARTSLAPPNPAQHRGYVAPVAALHPPRIRSTQGLAFPLIRHCFLPLVFV